MTTLETVGRRVYFVNSPFAAKDAIKGIGAKWDADRRQWWIGTNKREDAEKLVASLNDPAAEAPKENPDNIRLVGKATYKGRTYYVRCLSQDRTRARLITLDAAIDFWVQVGTGESEAQIVKSYQPREERGAYGRPTGRMIYQTLGSIQKFIEKQKREEAAGTPKCAECGKRGQLCQDLEDGLMKCYSCCDMPAN